VVSKKRIVIVDDDQELLETLEELLTINGYAVETACDGKKAMELLADSPTPSLVLLDLMMPQVDGWQLRSDMLRDTRLAAVPVIVISAVADLPSAAVLGAAHLLTKPFRWADLAAAIESVLPTDVALSTRPMRTQAQ
jgi:DNA-binding response OmpR family regulator